MPEVYVGSVQIHCRSSICLFALWLMHDLILVLTIGRCTTAKEEFVMQLLLFCFFSLRCSNDATLKYLSAPSFSAQRFSLEGSSSLQIIPLFLFTVMWLFVMPLTPNALKDVHQAEEEDARRVLTWLMSILWLRAQFRWCSKKERKNSQVAWIWGVCILINDQ